MITLVVTESAKQDLRNIYGYTLEQWGALQADKYLEKLKASMWLLTDNPELGMNRSDLLENIQSYSSEKHVLYYRFTSNSIIVLRILHGQQDPLIQLNNEE